MNDVPIYINGAGSISAIGANHTAACRFYERPMIAIKSRDISGELTAVASLTPEAEEEITQLREDNSHYAMLDKTALMAIIAARQAFQGICACPPGDLLVNIGSSRGAAETLERDIGSYITSGKVPVVSSPTTTLGNISSWVAQDLHGAGAVFSNSVTCSTALHALGNGCAWIRAGMASAALVGGSEAPLTPFTLAQMKTLRIYNDEPSGEYPCRPGGGKNSLVLGEGAAIVALSAVLNRSSLARIAGLGFAFEELSSGTSISEEGRALQLSMKRALSDCGSLPDAIVLHAPGTARGDSAEIAAVKQVFGEHHPPLGSNKWILGHTFAASGAFSLEAALFMIQSSRLLRFPYEVPWRGDAASKRIERVMVNATGFGGNAVSVIIEKIE